jgi:hypothetical protein
MTNEIKYYDTPYSYVNPIRYFKANDPYYYEVDNIPIKQLEESQRFLKDQVDGIITKQNNKKEIQIDRSNFSELLPYATGNDRKVRVKPGRYTSRINNAYNLTPLQVVRQIAGFSNSTVSDGELEVISDLNTWRVETNIGNYVSDVLQEFQQGRLGDALNMNGLAERAFVFPFDDEDGLNYRANPATLNVSSPGYSQFDSELGPDDRPLYPNYIGALLKHNTPELTRDLTLIKNVYTPGEVPFGGQQGRIESEFIKRWRGAIRTSIVDVPEELEITVPDFPVNANNEPEDFFYYDTNGNKQNLEANHRIDLLFIYSKAVDENETTIPKFDSAGNPTTLTAPTLGILKGAGIGISRQTTTSNNDNNSDDRVNLQSLDGTPLMLAHPGDEAGSTNGFVTSAGVIKGSFPSPDDLMNLAPVLSENLETDSFALIGQSILPVAYIRVQKASGPIPDIINDEDIIDIRPFFRTTELAYNERAGIAAATPQVSIANPVVTEAHLEKVRKEVYSDLRIRIDGISNENRAARNNSPTRVIAAGDVLGGFWGPEGALIKQARANAGGALFGATMGSLADLVEENYGYRPGSLPYYPQWDPASWTANSQVENPGTKICDYINLSIPYAAEFKSTNDAAKYLPPWRGGINQALEKNLTQIKDLYDPGYRLAMYNWGPPNEDGYRAVFQKPKPSGSGFYNIPGTLGTVGQAIGQGILNEINARNVQINFVSKRIKLDFESTPWVADYHVNVNLLHCAPLSDPNDDRLRNSSCVWVQRFKDYFVINVAWAGTNANETLAEVNGHLPWIHRNDPERFAGFVQTQMPLLGGSPFQNYSPVTIGRESFFNEITSQQSQTLFNQMMGDNPDFNTSPTLFKGGIPLLYPSVTWEVIGISEENAARSHGSNGRLMEQTDPTVRTV